MKEEFDKKIYSKTESKEETKETNKKEKIKQTYYITTKNETPMMIAKRFHLDVAEVCKQINGKWNKVLPENTKIKL